MSFPAMNAQSVAKRFSGATGPSTTTVLAYLPTGPHNIISVPGVVDVSGMEMSFGVAFDSLGVAGLGASTADASLLSVTLADGGPTGDATTTAVLATAITSSAAFVDTVPRDVAGTSATDLDADDWVNFQVTAQPTTVAGGGAIDVNFAYIYGKPGAIN
jgi:hypothetical protein